MEKKKFTLSKGKKKQIRRSAFYLVVVAIVCLFFSSLILINYFNDSSITAKKYFNAIVDKDWDAVYNLLDVDDDGPFLTKASYISLIEKEYTNLKTYYLEEPEKNTFLMTYGEENNQKETTIVMVEKEERFMLIYKQYAVQPIDLLAENISFLLPKDVSIKINGTLLNETYLDTTGKISCAFYEKVYTIPCLYIGSYLIEIFGDNYQTYTQEIEVLESDQCFITELPNLSENVISLLGEESFTTIYNEYERTLDEDNTQKDNSYAGIKLSDLSAEITEYGYNQTGLSMKVSVSYLYETKITKKETDEYTGMDYYLQKEIKQKKQKTFDYTYDGEKWLLSND